MDVILVSSHKDVRDALVENGIFFDLVYPEIGLKEEYLERYEGRGSNKDFIDLLDKMWDTWVTECENQEGCNHIVLGSGMFLEDAFLEA